MIRTIRRRAVVASGVAAGALIAPVPAREGWAKGDYQTDKIRRIVVPFAAGGTADSLGRVVAQILTESMSSTYFIENWTGAGGNVRRDWAGSVTCRWSICRAGPA